MMKRSGAFFAVVIVLAAVRYFARGYFDSILTLEQTGGAVFCAGLWDDSALAGELYSLRIGG